MVVYKENIVSTIKQIHIAPGIDFLQVILVALRWGVFQ